MSAAMLQSEASVVARVLDHIDRGSTDSAAGTHREPVANYHSTERYAAELALMRRLPVPFCPSAALPNAGDYLARKVAGIPLVAIRGQDHRVRVFRNGCRHRGTRLLDGAGCTRAVVCPYHAWSYGLDGTLRNVPHPEGFPGLAKGERGLVPVAGVVERDGFVIVTQEAAGIAAPPDFEGVDLFPPGWRVFRFETIELQANWKVLAEGFLEGYHIRATHAWTFFPLQYDNLNVVEHFGRNSRITYPYRAVERQREVPSAERSGRRAVTFLYHLFPNVMIATFPANRALVVLEPLAPDRTNIHTWVMTDVDDESAAAGIALVDSGLEEDRAMARAVQVGLASGANEFLEFGLYEGAIVHFHRQLHALLGD